MVTLTECGVCTRDKCKSLFAETPKRSTSCNSQEEVQHFWSHKTNFSGLYSHFCVETGDHIQEYILRETYGQNIVWNAIWKIVNFSKFSFSSSLPAWCNIIKRMDYKRRKLLCPICYCCSYKLKQTFYLAFFFFFSLWTTTKTLSKTQISKPLGSGNFTECQMSLILKFQ